LRGLTLATHVACAAIGVAATVLVFLIGDFHISLWVAAAVAFGLAAWLGWFVSNQVLRGLRLLERLGCQNNPADVATSSVREFDEAAQRLREHVHRRAVTDTNSRQQLREVTSLLSQIDRRSSGGGRSFSPGQRLRQVLDGMSATIDGELSQLLCCSADIEECMRELADGAERQSDALSKTATYVEQISASLEAVSKNADTTHEAASTARHTADQTVETVRRLVDNLEQIHADVASSEARLLSLGDRSQEISSMVERIREIASRTNLLALNASIESVRAGEHGRGFAVVAQEVHTLAEQSGQAAREISTLMEAMQMESRALIADVTNECAALQAETQRARAAVKDIEGIGRASHDAVSSLGEITFAAQHQLKLTQDLVAAVDRIAEVAKRARSCSEKAGWTTNTLAKAARKFDESVAPLRRCCTTREPTPRNHSPGPAGRVEGASQHGVSDMSVPNSADLCAAPLTTAIPAGVPTA
jgi:methyl-accepting chemotaxis protein